MPDPTLYEIGLDQWRDGRLSDAAKTLREVIRNASPNDSMRGEYHGSLGGVLSALGQDDEALREYEKALSLAMADFGDAAIAVGVPRYFVAEQLLKMNRPEEALSAVQLSLVTPGLTTEPVLRALEAEALWRLGQQDRAVDSARQAIETASPGTQRERLQDRLRAVLSGRGGPDLES